MIPTGVARTTTWQQSRRAETRERLVAAAERLFASSGYIATSVEDILAEAEIGRTTFYKHFDDKYALALTIFERFMEGLTRAYGQIARSERIDRAAIESWLDGLIDHYAAQSLVVPTFSQMNISERRFAEPIVVVQSRMMSALGERFASFAEAARQSPCDPLRTRAAMVLISIDHMCTAIALHGAILDRATAVSVVAEDFERFAGA